MSGSSIRLGSFWSTVVLWALAASLVFVAGQGSIAWVLGVLASFCFILDWLYRRVALTGLQKTGSLPLDPHWLVAAQVLVVALAYAAVLVLP